MKKPTAKALARIAIIRHELAGGYGAIVRAADRMGVTKQRAHQIFSDYPQYFQDIPAPPERLITCHVCDHEFPERMQYPGRNKGVCRDCGENRIYRCARCGCSYINVSLYHGYCMSCRSQLVAQRQKQIIQAGGPAAERLLYLKRTVAARCNMRARARAREMEAHDRRPSGGVSSDLCQRNGL